MALTTTEETQVRELLDKQAELLNLGENETTIMSKLGATKINPSQLPEVTSIPEAATLMVRDGTTDKKIRADKLRDSMRLNTGLTLVNLVGYTPTLDGTTIDIASFYAGYSTTTAGASGGGKFVWVASAAKSLHDGALYISPTVPWDGTFAGLAAWQNKTGETTPAGTGCWRRVTDGLDICSSWWGTVANDTSIDSAPSLNKMWAYAKALKETPASNITHIYASLQVPAGKYLINSSVNFTGLLTWNIHLNLEGVVFVAGSGCVNKAMFDATNTRGFHVFGGMIESTLAIGNSPMCGLLVGNSGTATCGNNNFESLKIMGSFTYAAYVNFGSETTYYHNCYFAQTAEDTVSVSRYAVVCDGMMVDTRIVSDYTTLRAYGTAVSFTNNKFYGSHFRNYGTNGTNGGSALYLRSNFDWSFDGGCYYLAFDKSNIVIYNDPTYRASNLKFAGLFETDQVAGVKNVIQMIVPDGSSCAISSFELSTMTPLASASVFKITNESGSTSTGSLKLTNANIQISTIKSTASMFSQCGNLRVYGYISTRSTDKLNLKDIAEFKGIAYVQDRTLFDSTGMSSKPMYFGLIDENGTAYHFGSKTHDGDLTVTGETNTKALEFEAFGGNSWLSVTSLSSGVADCSTKSLVAINLTGAQTLSGLTDSSTVSAPLIMLRNISTSDLTVQHNSSGLRLNGQGNKILKTNDSILFAKVASGIYQEIGGSNGYRTGDFTATGEVNAGALEAASLGSNSWLSVSSLSSGVLDCSTRSLISLSLASADTVTSLTDSSTVSVPFIFIRNIGSATVTFANNASFLRLINGNDVQLNQNESIAFAKVASGIYVQIAGKHSGVRNNSTGFGYGTGSGGMVTQATSKSNGVTLNKPTGKITMNAAALAAGATVVFTVTNSTVAATDALMLGFDGAGPTNQELNYRLAWAVDISGGAFRVVVQNVSGGSLSEAVQIRFSIIKSTNS